MTLILLLVLHLLKVPELNVVTVLLLAPALVVPTLQKHVQYFGLAVKDARKYVLSNDKSFKSLGNGSTLFWMRLVPSLAE